MAQDDLSISGWAFEARIYAEDAAKNFLPATGRLSHLRFPEDARTETGIRSGDEITPFYDPMIAKLIVRGDTRAEALGRLHAALVATQAAGSVTNLDFLARLASHDGFSRGDVDTGLIERDLEALTAPNPAPKTATALAAIAALGLADAPAMSDPFERRDGFRLWEAATTTARLLIGGELHALPVEIAPDGYRVTVDGAQVSLSLRALADGVEVSSGGIVATAHIARSARTVTIYIDGAHEFGLVDPLAAASGADGGGDDVRAPMPGLVKAISASVGDKVEEGATLAMMEAMKMEHTLKAPRDGVIASVNAAPGDQVDEGAILIALEPRDG